MNKFSVDRINGTQPMLIPHEIVEFYSDELSIQNFHLIKNDDYATYKLMNQLNRLKNQIRPRHFIRPSFQDFELKGVFSLKIVFIFSEKNIIHIYFEIPLKHSKVSSCFLTSLKCPRNANINYKSLSRPLRRHEYHQSNLLTPY